MVSLEMRTAAPIDAGRRRTVFKAETVVMNAANRLATSRCLYAIQLGFSHYPMAFFSVEQIYFAAFIRFIVTSPVFCRMRLVSSSQGLND